MALQITYISDATVETDASVSDLISGVFTPPAHSLLIVVACGALAGGPSPEFTLVDSEGLGFVRRAQHQGNALGGFSTIAVWTARVGASPVAMDVMRQSSAPTIRSGIMVFAVTDDSGIPPVFPIGQVAVAATTGTSMTATLPSTPAATSLVFGCSWSGPGGPGPTPGTGFTEIVEVLVDAPVSTAIMQAQYDLADADATCEWTALQAGGSIKLGIALEIAPVRLYSYAAGGGVHASGVAAVAPRFIRTVTGAGGAQSGGAATVTRLIVRSVTAAGGVQSGGAAIVVTSGAQTYTYAGAGGAQVGGSARIASIRNIAAAGGIAVGGAARVSRLRSPAISGGVQLGGAAHIAVTRAYRAAGGVQAGGAATVGRVVIVIGAGGVQAGGAASTSFGALNVETAELFFADAGSVLELVDARAGSVLQLIEADADPALELMVQS